MAANGKRIHIVPGPNGWVAREENRTQSVGSAPTQAEVQRIVREHLNDSRNGGEMITHRRDGRIRESDTIKRKDPYPPQG